MQQKLDRGKKSKIKYLQKKFCTISILQVIIVLKVGTKCSIIYISDLGPSNFPANFIKFIDSASDNRIPEIVRKLCNTQGNIFIVGFLKEPIPAIQLFLININDLILEYRWIYIYLDIDKDWLQCKKIDR